MLQEVADMSNPNIASFQAPLAEIIRDGGTEFRPISGELTLKDGKINIKQLNLTGKIAINASSAIFDF